jgi:hypothetical protein
VKCPRCLSVCLESDPICFSCRRPFVGNAVAWTNVGRSHASRLGLVLMVVGTCLGPVVGRAFMPGYSTELFDAPSLALAAAGGGLGALLGYALGALFLNPDW